MHENHYGLRSYELPVRSWNMYALFQAALLRLARPAVLDWSRPVG